MNEIDELMIRKASRAAVITGIVLMVVMIAAGIIYGRAKQAYNFAHSNPYTDPTWSSISRPITVVSEVSHIYVTSEVFVTIEEPLYVTRKATTTHAARTTIKTTDPMTVPDSEPRSPVIIVEPEPTEPHTTSEPTDQYIETNAIQIDSIGEDYE